MNLRIEKIRLKDLENFVQNETFQQFTTIPITILRAKSYLNNPNTQSNDVVLYLGFIEKQLVAFRSLFAGRIFSENESIRFAWCSGNWVHPGFRRKGFSEQLLHEAFADWNGKLMFTNYAPNSEKLYLKTGLFQPIHQFKGFRGYLFPKTRKLIQSAGKNLVTKFVFSSIDSIISVYASLRILFFNAEPNPDFEFKTAQFPDPECYQLLQNNSQNHIFERGETELNWIFQFPWISTEHHSVAEKYPFSSFSTSFYYNTIKVFSKKELIGFFIFSVREGHLKTLFFFIPEEVEIEVAKYLKQFCITQKIEVITVYNSEIAQHLFSRKFPFLHTKKYGQKIYSSFEIKNSANLRFQDGDGDVIFT
ncbi:MAG: N-acetyltransferase [Bacteroidetes bacterium]|nr:MAG: N-acetyltransferase [Bacteroidota bacterium]